MTTTRRIAAAILMAAATALTLTATTAGAAPSHRNITTIPLPPRNITFHTYEEAFGYCEAKHTYDHCVDITAGWVDNHLVPAPRPFIPKGRHLVPKYIDKPCATEDDMRNCYWDARQEGNGHGYSFQVVEMNDGMGTVCVIYQRRIARKWNDCS